MQGADDADRRSSSLRKPGELPAARPLALSASAGSFRNAVKLDLLAFR